MPRLGGLIRAVLGFVCALLGIAFLLHAFFADPTPLSRILVGVAGFGLLSFSFLLYRLSRSSPEDAATP